MTAAPLPVSARLAARDASLARIVAEVEAETRRSALAILPQAYRARAKAATLNYLNRPSRLADLQRGAEFIPLAELLVTLERRAAYCRANEHLAYKLTNLFAGIRAVKVLMRREREEARRLAARAA